jgi:hypothetical protein
VALLVKRHLTHPLVWGGLPCGERIVNVQAGLVRERLDTMVDLF